jgi:hypothetical protein
VNVLVCPGKGFLNEVFGILEIVGLIAKELEQLYSITFDQFCKGFPASLLYPLSQFFGAESPQSLALR